MRATTSNKIKSNSGHVGLFFFMACLADAAKSTASGRRPAKFLEAARRTFLGLRASEPRFAPPTARRGWLNALHLRQARRRRVGIAWKQ